MCSLCDIEIENDENVDVCRHGLPRDEICARCDDERIEHEQREWDERYWRRQLLEIPRE